MGLVAPLWVQAPPGAPFFTIMLKLIMKKTIILPTLCAAALLAVSCTPSERGALIGGAVGAIAGSEIAKNRAHRNRHPYYNSNRHHYYNYSRQHYYNYSRRDWNRPFYYY